MWVCGAAAQKREKALIRACTLYKIRCVRLFLAVIAGQQKLKAATTPLQRKIERLDASLQEATRKLSASEATQAAQAERLSVLESMQSNVVAALMSYKRAAVMEYRVRRCSGRVCARSR